MSIFTTEELTTACLEKRAPQVIEEGLAQAYSEEYIKGLMAASYTIKFSQLNPTVDQLSTDEYSRLTMYDMIPDSARDNTGAMTAFMFGQFAGLKLPIENLELPEGLR